MDTRYWLRQNTLGPQNPVPLNSAQYNEILTARSILIDAKDFEERYEMVLGNFLDLERFFAAYAIEAHLRFDYDYKSLSAAFMDSNRRIMNLLTTFKSYIDQTPRDFKSTEIDFKGQFLAGAKKTYDTSKAYRFVCALRNHTQHHSVPVHRIKGNPRTTPLPDRISFICEKQFLAENGDFKSSVLTEMEDNIDLRENFRQFMIELSKLHVSLRGEAAGAVKQAREVFEKAIEIFLEAQPAPALALGLTICEKIDDEYIGPKSVMLDWDDTRIALTEKNRILRID